MGCLIYLHYNKYRKNCCRKTAAVFLYPRVADVWKVSMHGSHVGHFLPYYKKQQEGGCRREKVPA